MSVTLQRPVLPSVSPPQGAIFRSEAATILARLRATLALVLSDLGNFRRPADIQKTLGVDKNLGRQLFRIAQTAEPLEAAVAVPSRISMRRFIEVAQQRGASPEKLDDVWTAFENFELLVEKHAGDRGSFNSIVASLSSVDDEWHIADAQHRRNVYRAMSHSTGMQAKVKLACIIANTQPAASTFDLAQIGGFVDMRFLRPLEKVRVHGFSAEKDFTDHITPLGNPDRGNLLEDFSSKPAPQLTILDRPGVRRWRNILLDHPEIGNAGTTTLFFGEMMRNLDAVSGGFSLQHTVRIPVETLVFDLLIRSHPLSPPRPTAHAVIGDTNTDAASADIIDLQGNFTLQPLGQGPESLISPEIPRYLPMLQSVQQRLAWDLTDYTAWRLRLDFPLYQSTVKITWPAAAPAQST